MPARRSLAAVGAVIAVSLAGLAAGAPKSDIPAAVRKTVDRLLGTAAKIHHEGKAFEAARKTDLEVLVSATGALEETAVEIPLGSLPTAVVAGAKAKAGKGATLREAEVTITDTAVMFEVEVRLADGTELEYQVDVSGKVLGEEHEDGDDDKDDDDDDDDKDGTP